MSVPVLGNGDKQEEEQKRIERIAKGEVSGVKSSRYTITDKGELASQVSSMNGKAKDKKKGKIFASGLYYALAAERDAKYSAAGRCYMRKTALSSRMRIAFMRSLMFSYLDEYGQ